MIHLLFEIMNETSSRSWSGYNEKKEEEEEEKISLYKKVWD
jgi:hypothetical protein